MTGGQPRTGVLGIDPGATGAIVLLSYRGGGVPVLLAVSQLPTHAVEIGKRTSKTLDAAALAMMLGEWEHEHGLRITRAIVERVGAMPKDKSPQAFAFGRSYGAVIAALEVLGIFTTTVSPAKWREAVGVARNTRDENADDAAHRRKIKTSARKRAAQLWPEKADWFRRVKDADAAEAALIGLSGFTLAHPLPIR